MDQLLEHFNDPDLLDLALTHSSVGVGEDNERLEFLGDAVLDLIVAEDLFKALRDEPEGVLTEMKAWVVSRATLAEAARALEVEQHVRVGPGLRGRALPRSVLANLYEAVLGAIYLDQGLEASVRFVERTLAGPLDEMRSRRLAGNPKQELQQICQRRWGSPPDYVLVEEYGRSHARAYLVAAEAGRRRFPPAWGRTMKEAERWAAHEALLVLEDEGGRSER